MSPVGYWYITIHFNFFRLPYLHKMVCFMKSWEEIIGLIHALEKRYDQIKTQLFYNFGSV